MSDNRASYYERIRGRLLALVIELGDRLTLDEQNWAHEYVDANELGLALEMIADWLSEGLRPIAAAERDTMLGLVEEMGMGDRVARALDLCPTKLDRGEGGMRPVPPSLVDRLPIDWWRPGNLRRLGPIKIHFCDDDHVRTI